MSGHRAARCMRVFELTSIASAQHRDKFSSLPTHVIASARIAHACNNI
jgi:hypothetical protein